MTPTKLLDIVIISYAKDDYCKGLTENCIKSILVSEKYAESLFNVIVVESEPGVKWEHLSEIVHTFEAPIPYGYHKFLNFGRKSGKSEWVALCNNDLEFTKGWFSNMIKASVENPDTLSFSPICPRTQPMYGIFENSGYYKGYNIRKEISGWCIVQKRDIYEIIGDLDERFHHWFCDNDYAMELQYHGISHILVTDSVVVHHDKNIGKTTERVVTDPNQMHEMTMGSQPIFIEKWKNKIK
jgi:hypothetical protein